MRTGESECITVHGKFSKLGKSSEYLLLRFSLLFVDFVRIENAEFEQVRSLGEESLGDESLSEDAGNDKDTSESEEISRKRKGDSLETQQSNQPYQKKQRQKKARCWPHLDVVVENNQKIAICKFCKTRMKCGSTGCTTMLNRHVDKCRDAHEQTLKCRTIFYVFYGN
ncbi:hypothetical protein POM88_048490 [Heracleum sosnowskyi]|uniref:BED-type domain-containing protein n=1 Tax=Heracleum sosnowskyi TaxID=360622 RepID=A0AAD8M0I3_9APIA|nr:hypothetical protein POM88_048490 [Heracleum sosnowskyi]